MTTALVAEEKQNITLRLSKSTIQKAKVMAARKSTSISALLSDEIDRLVGEDDAYEQAMKRAFALMEKGMHLGGVHNFDRDAIHER